MATLSHSAESVQTVNFDQALLMAASRAKAVCPTEAHMIEKGLSIAVMGEVVIYSDVMAYVRSQSRKDTAYVVEGRCPCQGASKAPGGRCSHRWAVSLARKAERLCFESQQALHEYPAMYENADAAIEAAKNDLAAYRAKKKSAEKLYGWE